MAIIADGQCASCAALRRELAQLREASEQRARQDHDQCVAMFQQMQALVQLNGSMMRGCGHLGGCSSDRDTSGSEVVSTADSHQEKEEKEAGSEQVQRLQAIIVQQAKEIESMRRRQRDGMVDGRVGFGNQQEAVDDALVLLHASLDESATGSIDCDDADGGRSDCRSAARHHASQLHKLPLASLHAQLKGKDLQLQRLRQIISKLEARFSQLVDRKRSMAQSFQQTTRTQQAHLKKYLAYIRQQTAEKKELERQVRELNQYVGVLEKKVVDNSIKASSQKGPDIHCM